MRSTGLSRHPHPQIRPGAGATLPSCRGVSALGVGGYSIPATGTCLTALIRPCSEQPLFMDGLCMPHSRPKEHPFETASTAARSSHAVS